MTILRAAFLSAVLMTAMGTAPVAAQGSDQCNYYPTSPGCPNYQPGLGERNPRIGPTYPHEAPRYHRQEAPRYYRQGNPEYYQQRSRSGRGRCPPGYDWLPAYGKCSSNFR